MSQQVLVSLRVTVAIDREVWERAYGAGETTDDIRDSVREYTHELLQSDFDNRGLVARVGVKS